MKIIIASNSGFCGGVKRAVKLTDEAIELSDNVYLKGDLIHNKSVMENLKSKGLQSYDEEMPEKSKVIIRSHGEKLEIKNHLLDLGNEIIDTTCPVLVKIYKDINDMVKKGYQIIIVGDKNHPEVIAINSHIDYKGIVINSVEEARGIKDKENLYIISQTTNIKEKFTEIFDIIVKSNRNVVVNNTICNATRKRQESCINLAQEVDAMIVIGGKHSSNTKKLYDISSSLNSNTYWIEMSEELDFEEIIKYNSIGITAGASTPSWIIEEVYRKMENYSKDEFMEQVEDSITRIYPKEIVKGEVIYVTDEEVIVNIGYKSDGIVTQDELSNDPDVKPKDLFEEGQEIEVYVIKLDDGEGNVVLSTRRVEGLKNWEKLVEACENEENITVNVTKEVKGGLLGNAMGIVAFLPGSQVTTYFVKDLGQFVGQDLECRILSVDERKRRLVVSSKIILEEETAKKVDEVWDSIEEGEVISGKVARLVDFGAFINFGGVVDGLIHISDIAWNRIDNPSEVLNVGDVIDVIVLKKNRDRNRISLGYKQLQQKPFESFVENNAIGDIVKGKVVNITDFGAFVRLDEGVEGLVHISEISHDHVEKPSDELNIDQEIEVKILNVDDERKRIGLSIKALTEAPKKEEKDEVEDNRPRRPKQKRSKPRRQRQTESYQTGELDTSIGALIDFDFGEEFDSVENNDYDETDVSEENNDEINSQDFEEVEVELSDNKDEVEETEEDTEENNNLENFEEAQESETDKE